MSFWSWFSSSVNCGPLGVRRSRLAGRFGDDVIGCGLQAHRWSSWPRCYIRPCRVEGRCSGVLEVAQVEGAQALGAVVTAVEEATVDAVVGGALPS